MEVNGTPSATEPFGQLEQVIVKSSFQSANVLPVIPALPNNVQPVKPPDAKDSAVTFPVTAAAAPIMPIRATTPAEVAFKVKFPFEETVPDVGVITLIISKGFPSVRVDPALFKIIELIDLVVELVCVINNEFETAPVPPIVSEEVDVPVKAPLVIEAGKVIELFKVSNLPFKLMIPFEWLNAFVTVKLLPKVKEPAPVLLTENLCNDNVVENVKVPRLPAPLIIKFELLPPLIAPVPVTEPLIVQLKVFDVFKANIMPEFIIKLLVILVLVVLARLFIPLPLIIKL